MLSAPFVLAHHGGIAHGSLLQEYGISRRTLADAVDAGELMRVRVGVFALPNCDPAIVEAAVHGGALTCTLALRLHGVWTLQADDRVHVWLGGNGRVHHSQCSCVGHWHKGRARPGLAPLEEVLLHVYRCAGAEAFFAALESTLVQRKLSASAIRSLRARMPASARWLIDLARSDAGSGLESLLRLRLHLIGITLDCQVVIPTVGRVDFVIAGRLILEADGGEFHGGAANRHRDLRRDAAASALGYETLRFDYGQIVHDWPSVERAVVGALLRLDDRR